MADIVIEDESWRQGFTQVPNVVLRDRKLSVGAKLAYSVLLSYAWQSKSCYPGQVRMAKDMGVGEKSIRRYLAELVRFGVLVIVKRGNSQTNVYRLPRLMGDPREA